MSRIGRYLNRQLEVWRTTTVPDGAGGQQTTLAAVGTVRAKVDQPSPAERLLAQQGDSKHSHDVFLTPGADVQRGDQLRGTDGLGVAQVFRVLSVIQPSRPVYSKADCELIEKETD